MKKSLVVMAALVSLVMAGTAMAATTTVNISANIVGTCRFDTTPTLAFGALDQTVGTDATAGPVDLKFWCTNGTAYTLNDPDTTADGSYTGSITNGTDTIPVAVTYTNFSGNGAGKSTLITSQISGLIVNADYVDVSAGAYNGSMVFTVTP